MVFFCPVASSWTGTSFRLTYGNIIAKYLIICNLAFNGSFLYYIVLQIIFLRGSEGLAAASPSPYLDNIETIGGMKNPCFWLCHAENRDFACIVFGGDYLKNGQKKAASSGGSLSAFFELTSLLIN